MSADRSPAQVREWLGVGTELFLGAVRELDPAGYAAATPLPGWNRAHVVAHVAGNADALGNLVRWARTGIETPMYSSAQQRNRDIEVGALRDPAELAEWVSASAQRLTDGLDVLSEQHWQASVVTAQGRTVPATEIPWMRTREVMVHAVDLDAGVGFAGLPEGFLAALVTDIVGKRTGADQCPWLRLAPTDHPGRWTLPAGGIEADPVTVVGSLAALAAYLAGRGDHDVTRADGTTAPHLPRWL
jgi:maleylpyruvate isomerase